MHLTSLVTNIFSRALPLFVHITVRVSYVGPVYITWQNLALNCMRVVMKWQSQYHISGWNVCGGVDWGMVRSQRARAIQLQHHFHRLITVYRLLIFQEVAEIVINWNTAFFCRDISVMKLAVFWVVPPWCGRSSPTFQMCSLLPSSGRWSSVNFYETTRCNNPRRQSSSCSPPWRHETYVLVGPSSNLHRIARCPFWICSWFCSVFRVEC
jgi:hypothetical protein